MDEQPVVGRAILEILGAPKEYVEKALKDYVDGVRKVHAIEKEVFHEAVPKEPLFSAFCELEIRFKTPLELLDFCFESMPSSIEILHPEKISFSTNDLTDFLNDLQARLHYADMIVKNLKAQSIVLDKNATNIFQNFIIRMIEQEPRTIEQLAKIVGVQEKEIFPFAERLVQNGRIKKKNGFYMIENAEKQA